MIIILPVDRSLKHYHRLLSELDDIGATYLMPLVAEYALERAVAGPPPAYVQAEEDLYDLLTTAIEEHLGISYSDVEDDNISLKLSTLLTDFVEIINHSAKPMMKEWERWVPELKTYDQHEKSVERINKQGLFLRVENA